MQFLLRRAEVLTDIRHWPPIVQALLMQACAMVFCIGLAWVAQLLGIKLILGQALLLQSLIVVAFSMYLRMPPWWLVIQALFVPALVFALSWQLASYWYLLAFLLMLSVFWTTFTTRVPLYLSRQQVWEAVAQQLPSKTGLSVADLGSGLGGLVHYLARQRKDSRFQGIEFAPLPSLLSKLRTAWQPNSRMIWGDFWQRDLGEFDVVFAYLSPVPMPALWEKVKREMRPGSLFISYRFVVPGAEPTHVITLQDIGQTKLYVWQR